MKTKQKNVRFDELTLALLERMVSKKELGTQSDVVRKGIIELAEKVLCEKEYTEIVLEYIKR